MAMVAVAMLSGCASAGTTSSRTTIGPLVYVALGASDAVGTGTSDPAHDNWPTVLSGELGRPARLVNLGVSGETAAQATTGELPAALAARPDIVTVWLAVDDLADGVSLDDYTNQLHALLAGLHDGSHARVFVGNVPDVTLLPAFRSFAGKSVDLRAVRATVQSWNAAIARVARGEGAMVVDIYSAWQQLAQHPEYVSADGFHPSTAGAQALAQLFAAAIKQSGVA
jgi:lysophospholipase L1-like esterase